MATTARLKVDLICRVCLCERPGLADLHDPRTNLPEIIMTCTSVKVSPRDGMPSRICEGCAELASSAFAFKGLCERSDAKLKSHLAPSFENIKQETESSINDGFQIKTSLYDCVLCDQGCNSSRELIKHALDIHSSERNRCKLCSRIYATVFALNRHEATHDQFTVDDKYNVCPICRQEFARHGALLKHMNHHAERSPFECEDCKCFFTSEAHLVRHKRKKHKMSFYDNDAIVSILPSEDSFQQLEVKIEPDQEPINSYVKCEQYLSELIEGDSQEGNVKSDMKKEFQFDLLSDRDNDSDNEMNDFSDYNTGKRSSKISLKKKRKSKNPKLKITKNKRGIEREYFCATCGNGFFKKSHLSRHIKSIHSKCKDAMDKTDSSYLCAVCGKGYRKQASLAKHVITHSNEKATKPPLVCPICSKVVNHSNHLVVHMRTHRDRNGQPLAPEKEDPDKKINPGSLCTMCGKSCSSKSNLAVHMRRHLGVMTCICKICGKGYPRTTDLTLHMRSHTGERPFVCSVCNRGFARSDKLAIHMRIHTGEKPYSCQLCNRSFAQSNDLAAHKKRNNCTASDAKTNLAIPVAGASTIKPPVKFLQKAQNESAKASNMWESNRIAKPNIFVQQAKPSEGASSIDIENHLTNNLLVVAANNANSRMLELKNCDIMTARAVSDLMKQNLIIPDMINTQRALQLVGHTNLLAAHQRGDLSDYTSSLLQSISNVQNGQFDMR